MVMAMSETNGTLNVITSGLCVVLSGTMKCRSNPIHNMLDIIKAEVNEVTTVTTENAKTGSLTTRIQRAKEFKETYKKSHPAAGNREIKRAYEKYCTETMTGMAKGFDFQKAISLAQANKLGIESIRVNRDGDKTSIVFVDLSSDSEAEVQAELEKMPVETLAKMLEFIHQKLNTGAGLPK